MSQSTPNRGRRPSSATRNAILSACFEILGEVGYSGMSIEGVASRAGAGKTTIYRWWNGKAQLAVDAFFHATLAELAFPDTGSAESDFRAQIIELAAFLRGPRGAVLAAMLNGARNDPELANALQTRWLEPRRRWGVERMSRAMNVGECREGIDMVAALAVLYSPLYTPLLFGQDVPSRMEVEAYLAIACQGIFLQR